MTKHFLFISGKSDKHNGECHTEMEISENELDEFSDVISAIKNKKNHNWIWGIEVFHSNQGFQEKYRISSLYPEIPLKILLKFQEYLPGGISTIESIRIIAGEMKTVF